jgi:putative oxidoreductase
MTALARSHPGFIASFRAAFVSARAWLERFPLSLLQLGMRIGIGAVFFKSGLLKVNSWEFAVKLFQDEYKVPLLNPVFAAQITAFVELTVPVFLFLGLATRLATLPLLGMVFVIQTFVYPQAWTEHLLWASVLILLLTRGPGIFSLDHAIERSLFTILPRAFSSEVDPAHVEKMRLLEDESRLRRNGNGSSPETADR